jgi:hypothetical protein
MADIDWSNIPREVIDLDPLGPPDVLFVGYFGEDNGAKVVVPHNTFYVGLFDGDLLADPDAYGFNYLVQSYYAFDVIESGTQGYPGLSNGTEVVPYPWEDLPIAVGQLAGASLIFIPFHCDEVNNEYWG